MRKSLLVRPTQSRSHRTRAPTSQGSSWDVACKPRQKKGSDRKLYGRLPVHNTMACADQASIAAQERLMASTKSDNVAHVQEDCRSLLGQQQALPESRRGGQSHSHARCSVRHRMTIERVVSAMRHFVLGMGHRTNQAMASRPGRGGINAPSCDTSSSASLLGTKAEDFLRGVAEH